MEIGRDTSGSGDRGLRIRILGPVSITRNGEPQPLPRSRKVRALLAFLVLESRALSRSSLCDLLWAVADDPRGELRWCLSKLRAQLDDEGRHRVVTTGDDSIALDLSDCHVDAIEVDRVAKTGVEHATSEQLAHVCDSFGGELLEGIAIDGSPEFTAWLAAQRTRYRSKHVAVLGELVARAPRGSDEAFRYLGVWLRVAPFDLFAHERMLEALLKSGQFQDAEEHARATFRSFEQEGLDWSSLRDVWQTKRAMLAPAVPIQLTPAPLPPVVTAPAASIELRRRRRGSIAVMPFMDTTSPEPGGRNRTADGLTEDIITGLAKLRMLFVIARGTVYALGERGIGAREAGRILNVEYVASGTIRRQGDRVSIIVELAETEDARIVWTDEFDGTVDQTFAALDAIVNRIVAAISEEVESEECSRAILKAPNSLDAWESYHRGLWHMYRFNGPDNVHAGQFFRRALDIDSRFARAHAGLSFTHFQNAFLGLTPDGEQQIARALETASQSLGADERDPAAHWAMGRALWLNRNEDAAVGELERCIELSPNFALGYYTLGFVHSQTGDPRMAIETTDYSRQLSPFDPLLFAMLAARALALVRLGEMDEAAAWAVKAAGRPNAHAHILAVAAQSLALANRRDEARKFVRQIRERLPSYNVEEFLRAFRFNRDTERLFRRVARQIGFDSGAG